MLVNILNWIGNSLLIFWKWIKNTIFRKKKHVAIKPMMSSSTIIGSNHGIEPIQESRYSRKIQTNNKFMTISRCGDPEIDLAVKEAIRTNTLVSYKPLFNDTARILMNLSKEILIDLWVAAKRLGFDDGLVSDIRHYVDVRYRQGGKEIDVDAMLHRALTTNKPPELF